MGIGIGHRGDLCQALPPPQSFIVKKEECFVFLDRSAKTAAELVLAEGRQFRPVIECAGIERAVAQIFEQRTVKTIRARLGDRVHSRPGAAELSAVRIGLGGKLGDRFHAESRSQYG